MNQYQYCCVYCVRRVTVTYGSFVSYYNLELMGLGNVIITQIRGGTAEYEHSRIISRFEYKWALVLYIVEDRV